MPAPPRNDGARLAWLSVGIVAAAVIVWMAIRGDHSVPASTIVTTSAVPIAAPDPAPPGPHVPVAAPPTSTAVNAPVTTVIASPTPVIAPPPPIEAGHGAGRPPMTALPGPAPMRPVVDSNPAPQPLPPSSPAPPVAAEAQGSPGAGSSLTQQAQRLLERGSATRAAEIARKATTADPQSAEAWLTLGAAYDAAGARAQAHLAYKNCVDSGRGPRVAECKALLGE